MTPESEAIDLPINVTILSLVLIFIPGIVCYGIIAALAEKKKRDNVTIFLQIFGYGIASYLLLAVAHCWLPWVFPGIESVSILNPSQIGKGAVDPIIVAYAAGFGAVQGALITLNLNRQYIMKLCRKIGLTTRFADADVWTLLLNSTATDNWVTIRHKSQQLTYQGYVSGFSTGAEARELLLINVRVFDTDTMQEVAGIPFLYLAFTEDDVTLEFGAGEPEVKSPKSRTEMA